MDKMSARLRGDTASHVASLMLSRIGYFSDPSIEADFLANAALCLRVAMYCPREYIPCTTLVIVERGICARNGKIAGHGSVFGEDMVLNSPTFRESDPATALTFVQAHR